VRAGLIPIKEIVRDNFERLEKIFKEGKSITGIPTGYTELDKLTSGLQPSELLICGASFSGEDRAGAELDGKHRDSRGHPVAMFSLEMSRNRCCSGLVASCAD